MSFFSFHLSLTQYYFLLILCWRKYVFHWQWVSHSTWKLSTVIYFHVSLKSRFFFSVGWFYQTFSKAENLSRVFPSQHSFFFSLISHFEYYDVIYCFLMMPNYVNLFFPLSWTLFWLLNYWINYSLPRNAIWSVSFLMIMYILNYISLAGEFVFALQHLEDNELRVLATYMALYGLVCIILSS